MKNKYVLILLAAGNGERLYKDIGVKKQFYRVENKELFLYSLETFIKSKIFSKVILVIDRDDEKKCTEILNRENIKNVTLVYGGKDRNESVFNGLKNIGDIKDTFVFIHDSARPLVSDGLINRLLDATKKYEAITPVIPLRDSILKDGNDGIEYLDRRNIMQIQTPQVFKTEKLLKVYECGFNSDATDDFKKVYGNAHYALILGDILDFKITYLDDLNLFKKIIEK